MLGTSLLAFSALDAVGCLAALGGMYIIIVVVRIPVVVKLLGVHYRKQIRDGNVFRASVGAVTAGGSENIAVSGIAAGKALLQRSLTFSLNIAVGGIEIVKPCIQKRVHHAFSFL